MPKLEKPAISVIAPAFNEDGNIKLFCLKTAKVMKEVNQPFEIIIVDDGSTDNTFAVLKKLKKTLKQLRIIRFRRNFGQTAGLMAGFHHARGDILVTLDSDLQHDPVDIKKLIAAINQGADVVSGRRQKKPGESMYSFVSFAHRWFNKKVLGVNLKDISISPNAYRKSALKDINLYGEMHRFLISILYWRGFKIEVVDTICHPRHSGQTNYKPTKAIRGFLDLFIIKFWQDYSVRPIHFFGSVGLILMAVGGLLGLEEAVKKLIFHISIYNSNLPLLAAFLTIIGVQFFILGILADVLIRIYYKKIPNYQIETIIR